VNLTRIVFVCTGNICRSPTAEIVLRALLADAGLADRFDVASAGTGDWHVGQGADRRSLAALTARGYDGRSHRARQFAREWFDRYDLIVALDAGHLADLRRMAPPGRAGDIRLLREFDPQAGGDLDVPDPYYGDAAGFAEVLDIVERSCGELVRQVAQGQVA
jgi:protein-tyrosine phosphatase